MSDALQVILFLAAGAFIVLVACLIPFLSQVVRQMELLVHAAEHLMSDAQVLLQDSRGLLHNVTEISVRVNQQMVDAGKVVNIVQGWTQRADRLVSVVGSTVEPPVYGLARTVDLFRAGGGAFLRTLFASRKHTLAEQEEDQS